MDYLIRYCKEEDMEAIVGLCIGHALHERAEYDPAGKQELLTQLLFASSPRIFCLVVEIGGRVVGYATYTFDYSTWDAGKFLYMDCLYLEPACRGLHIGEELVRELAAIAGREGCVNMQWQTPDHNEGAIRFYRRIGAEGRNKVRFSMEVRP